MPLPTNAKSHVRWPRAVAVLMLLATGSVAACDSGPPASAFEPKPRAGTVVASLDPATATSDSILLASEPPLPPDTVVSDALPQPIGCSAGSTAEKLSTNPFATSALIGDSITATATDCGPLVVITFTTEGDMPGWGVGYQSEPVTSSLDDASVTLAGDATLVFNMGSWMGTFGVGYQGPTDLPVRDVPGLRELRLIANANGTSSWAIGLDTKLPFTITELSNPARIELQFLS